jgi:hypothetical protein
MSTSVQDLLKALKEIEQQLQIYHATRQNTLEALTKRRDVLKEELAAVERDLAALSSVAPPRMPAAVASAVRKRKRSLSKLLVDILNRKKVPMSSKELAQAALKAGYTSKSSNFLRVVDNRLSRLKAEGKIQAAPSGGYQAIPADTAAPVAAVAETDGTAAAAKPRRKRGARKGRKARAARRERSSLSKVLAEILQKEGRPLTASELADAAIASGYQSNSKNFKDVIWVTLGKMKKEHKIAQVAGQRWELVNA